MTVVQERPAAPSVGGPLEGRAGTALVAAALLACAAGVLAGLLGGPLWLDEALSVEIARLPVPDLFAALRQDGAPPLYYLLLHAWIGAFGTGTLAVRLLTVLLVPLALWLGFRLGERLGGRSGGRAALVVLAALPWTMRYGSETRMYLLVVVLSLAGTLALLRVRSSGSRGAVLALAACVAALLLTHYWSLYLLTAVGLVHLPGVVRRSPEALRVAAAGVLGVLAFLPWLPTFLFQAAHTGAPWADPASLLGLLRTPRYWGGGPDNGRIVMALLIVSLASWAALRGPRLIRPALGVVLITLLLAWTQTALLGGAYTGRYTAVVVPLMAVAVGLGAAALPGRWAVASLAAFVLLGAATGVRAAAVERTSAQDVAEAFTDAAAPGDVLVYCPDQLGPPVSRAIGGGYEQVLYPTLDPPQLIDWVDYTERNEAASPASVAARVDALAGSRQLFVLKATGYRTFESDDDGSDDAGLDDLDLPEADDCDALLAAVADLRGLGEHLSGDVGTTGQLLYRFDGR